MARVDENPPLKLFRLFTLRWLLSALVVFGAYNPSGTSYYHWVASTPSVSPPHIAVGILVLTAVIAIARMAFLSTGYLGTAALMLMLLLGIVFCIGLGLFAFEDVTFTTYTVEAVISLILGTGLSWAFIQRRLSGERDILRNPP
jgi:hypothetical protein